MCEDKADDAAKWFCFLDLFLETPLWHDADIEDKQMMMQMTTVMMLMMMTMTTTRTMMGTTILLNNDEKVDLFLQSSVWDDADVEDTEKAVNIAFPVRHQPLVKLLFNS